MGFSEQQRMTIIARCKGTCEVCGRRPPVDIHHRQPRGMGGSTTADTIPNGIAVCRACHEWVERNRTQARANGWLVSRYASPATQPLLVNIRNRQQLVYLTDEGTYSNES